MDSAFEQMLLEPEQEDLLKTMVEASRRVPRERRHKFILSKTMAGDRLRHEGLPGKHLTVYHGNLEVLTLAGLLNETVASRYSMGYDILPLGYGYYEYLHRRSGQPIVEVEEEMRRFLGSDVFRSRHPLAYQKWTESTERLWGDDSLAELTTIGHLCREAMQEFIDDLVKEYQPQGVGSDKSKTVDRMRLLLDHRKGQVGETEGEFLDALLNYWGTLQDLIQRQEHGANREGEALVWEDARRVVFQTAVVMFEIDKSLSRRQ